MHGIRSKAYYVKLLSCMSPLRESVDLVYKPEGPLMPASCDASE